MNSTRTEEGEEKKSKMSEEGIYGCGKADWISPATGVLSSYVMTFCVLEANDQVTCVMNIGGHHIWLFLSLSHPPNSEGM